MVEHRNGIILEYKIGKKMVHFRFLCLKKKILLFIYSTRGIHSIQLSVSRYQQQQQQLYFQLLIPPTSKRFDIFSPRLGDAQKV